MVIAKEHIVPGYHHVFDVVVIGSSAGGLGALTSLLGGLPMTFPAAILVVQHLDPRHRSLFPKILGRATKITVREACAGDELTPGVVAMAAPNRHLVIGKDVRLGYSDAEPVHHLRPSVDILFESAALHLGATTVAVVLSGTGSDGARGVRAVKGAGGIVIVEDPFSAEFNGMPQAALDTGVVDFVLPIGAIGAQLLALTENRRAS